MSDVGGKIGRMTRRVNRVCNDSHTEHYELCEGNGGIVPTNHWGNMSRDLGKADEQLVELTVPELIRYAKVRGEHWPSLLVRLSRVPALSTPRG
jgi:hypothetical protein